MTARFQARKIDFNGFTFYPALNMCNFVCSLVLKYN